MPRLLVVWLQPRIVVGVALGAIAVSQAPTSLAATGKIAFERPSNERPGTDSAYRIWSVQPSGKGLHQLKTSSDASGSDLSRDGRKLAWSRVSGSSSLVFAGDNEAQHAKVVLKRSGAGVGRTRWSPSGRALAFSEGNFAHRHIGVLDLRSKQVTTFAGISLGDWSPDGSMIVGSATATAATGPVPGLYVLDVGTGTTRTILTFPGNDEPLATWAPDGRRIAFSRTDSDLETTPNPVYQLWVVDPDGSNLRQVTSLPRGASSPTWSPDGSRLAFVAGGAKSRQYLATVRLDGTGVKRVTRDVFRIVNPDWAP
jgi:Tol biopolymer transport system component